MKTIIATLRGLHCSQIHFDLVVDGISYTYEHTFGTNEVIQLTDHDDSDIIEGVKQLVEEIEAEEMQTNAQGHQEKVELYM